MPSAVIAERTRHEGTPLSRYLVFSIAWGAMLIASPVPTIVWSQFTSDIPAWVSWIKVGLLLGSCVLTLFWRMLHVLQGYLLALVAFVSGWEILLPFLSNTLFTIGWIQALPIGLQILIQSLLRLIPGLFMLALVLLRHVKRKDLFLSKGNLHERIFPASRWSLFRSFTWLHLGFVFLVIAGIILPFYLVSTIKADAYEFSRLFINAPIVILCAALNTLNEEFEFRSVMFSSLLQMMGSQQVLWLTSVHFGLLHFYGQPSGVPGVLMAGFAGFLWGASVLRTKGMAWAWGAHFIQDIVIYSLLLITQ
jgi:membrane protease YdiL (CAAX protease family)